MLRAKKDRAGHLFLRLLTPAILAASAACGGSAPGSAPGAGAGHPGAGAASSATAGEATRAGRGRRAGVIDSVLPMSVMLDRFRRDLPRPATLQNGAESRDALVERVVAALQASDTMAFERLGVNRAEFAWLYFPNSVNARPPYELPPALAWFQLQEGNRKGVLRALRELGGHTLDYGGYTCAAEPRVEDGNRLWTGCAVTLAVDGQNPAAVKLFSAVLERDGRFAVLSYANDF